MDATAVSLPYDFDSVTLNRNILKGFLGGAAVLFALVLLALTVKHSLAAAAHLLICGTILGFVGHKFATVAEGAKGTITRDEVVVEPSAFYGIPLRSPAGRFPLQRFRAVRVEYLGPRAQGTSFLFARIWLIGHEGTPDVSLAMERDTTAKTLAPEIAAAVGLPLEQVGVAPL